jgi:hypothetical protein
VTRHRGGQPGNQNARKHGFYASSFGGQDKALLEEAANTGGMDNEIALVRARLKAALVDSPGDLRLINDAVSTLANLFLLNLKQANLFLLNLKQALSVMVCAVSPKPRTLRIFASRPCSNLGLSWVSLKNGLLMHLWANICPWKVSLKHLYKLPPTQTNPLKGSF